MKAAQRFPFVEQDVSLGAASLAPFLPFDVDWRE